MIPYKRNIVLLVKNHIYNTRCSKLPGKIKNQEVKIGTQYDKATTKGNCSATSSCIRVDPGVAVI
jgi:hypothetical protein